MPRTHPTSDAGNSAGEVLAAAAALSQPIRARADEIERARRLPADLAAAMVAAGVFRMCIPRRLGGAEIDVLTMIRVLEDLSWADGSAGWCAMIGATSGVLSAYLDEATAREIYGDQADGISGGVFAPSGRAVATDGGYRVSGRWPFASGCENCGWLMGGCVVLDGGAPRLLPGGAPESFLMLFPASAAQIIDTWSVSGLCGTGSHDIAVTDLLVPHGRAVSLVRDPPRQPGPLYRFPVFGLLALGIAGVALGIARRAIDELVQLAGGKTPTGTRKRLAERPVIQAQVAEAQAAVRAARALLCEVVGEAWTAAAAAGPMPLAQRAALRLAATHAALSAARAVDLMYHAGGGTSVYRSSPLQRCFRDIHVVTQHTMVAPMTYELTGRLLLGIGSDTALL